MVDKKRSDAAKLGWKRRRERRQRKTDIQIKQIESTIENWDSFMEKIFGNRK